MQRLVKGGVNTATDDLKEEDQSWDHKKWQNL